MSTFNAGAIEATLTLGRSSWTRDLKKTQKEIQDLEKTSITIGIDADDDNAKVVMDNLERQLDFLDEQTYTPKITIADEEAWATLDRLRAELDMLDTRTVVVSFDADTDNFFVQADNVEKEMDLLEKDGVTIDFDANTDGFDAHLATVEAQIEAMSRQAINIDVDIDSAGAEAHLAILEEQIIAMDKQTINIDVDVDRAAMAGLVGAGGDGGGGSMGLLKILIMALIALFPILAVAISASTAAIIGFAAAVVGAAGPVAILAGGIMMLLAQFKKAKEAGELTGHMKDLADALAEFGKVKDQVLKDIGAEGFGLMAHAVGLLTAILPTLVPLFNATAGVIDDVLTSIGNFVKSPEYKEMLGFFGGFGLDMLRTFMGIGGNLILFFGRLFDAIAPFATQMMHGLEQVTADWAAWASGLESNPAFQRFVDNALKYGPQLLHLLGSIFTAFQHLAEATEPFAEPMLQGLTAAFDAIDKIPTDQLTVLIGLSVSLFAAFKAAPLISGAADAIVAFSEAIGISLGPLALIVGAVAIFAYAIYDLWKTNKDFRDGIKDTWNDIVNTVSPIINDIVGLIQDNWGPITEWASGIWSDFESIISDTFTSVEQIIHGVLWLIRGYWDSFGADTLKIFKGTFQMVGAVIQFWFQFIAGIAHLIKSVLTGDWRGAGEALKSIAMAFVHAIVNTFRGFVTSLRGLFGIIAKFIGLQAAWADGKRRAGEFVGWVKNKVGDLVGFFRGLPGKISGATHGMWDGIKSAFRSVINTIIGWWNNLHFGIPGFNKGPIHVPGFQLDTPNIPMLAEGAYVTEPMLAMVGEGRQNEVVAPESKMAEMARIAARDSGGHIDYDKLASVLVAAIAPLLAKVGGVTPEQIEALIKAASVNVSIDASDKRGAASLLASALGFEFRRLGYGGKANV